MRRAADEWAARAFYNEGPTCACGARCTSVGPWIKRPLSRRRELGRSLGPASRGRRKCTRSSFFCCRERRSFLLSSFSRLIGSETPWSDGNGLSDAAFILRFSGLSRARAIPKVSAEVSISQSYLCVKSWMAKSARNDCNNNTRQQTEGTRDLLQSYLPLWHKILFSFLTHQGARFFDARIVSLQRKSASHVKNR